MSSLILLAIYFLVLLMTFFISSKTVQGPWFFLLRAFFPNWKFYHALGWQPQLHVKVRIKELRNFQNTDSNGWILEKWLYPRARRDFLSVFHNPGVNIALANQNMVEHLSNDLQVLEEGTDPSQLVSYKIVDRFVASEILKDTKCVNIANSLNKEEAILEYRFEIHLKLNNPEQEPETHVLMFSPMFPVPFEHDSMSPFLVRKKMDGEFL